MNADFFLVNRRTGERFEWSDEAGGWVPVPPREKRARPNRETRARRRAAAEAGTRSDG